MVATFPVDFRPPTKSCGDVAETNEQTQPEEEELSKKKPATPVNDPVNSNYLYRSC